MHEIIPAVLEKTEEALKAKIASLPPEITLFHMDVLEEDVWTEFPQDFEAHLMVKYPEAIVSKWVERGARRIITHKVSENILKYRDKVEIGLAFELDAPIEDILVLAELADFVHVMAIAEIGEQGHPLDLRVFDRIKRIQEKFPNMIISVDGGITKENYEQLLEAGADRLVIGSHFNELWNSLKKD
jgi:pentose-5-phosphate-3-epimerase